MSIITDIKSEFECEFTLPQQHTITKIRIEDNDDDVDIIDVSDDDDFTESLNDNHVLEELDVTDTKYLNNVIDQVQNGAKLDYSEIRVKEEIQSDEDVEICDLTDVPVKEEPISDYEEGIDQPTIKYPAKPTKTGQVARKSTSLRGKLIVRLPLKGKNINKPPGKSERKEPVILIQDCLKPLSTLHMKPKPVHRNLGNLTAGDLPKPPPLTRYNRVKPRKSTPHKKVAAVIEEPEDEEEDEDESDGDVEIIDIKPSPEELNLSLQSDLNFESKLAVLGTLTQQDDSYYEDEYAQTGAEEEDEASVLQQNGDSSMRPKPLRGFSGKYLCTECDHSFSALSNLQRHVARFHSSGEINLPKCHICDKVFIWKKYLDEHLESVHNHVPTCPECGTVLKNRKTLEAHIKFVHGKKEEYPCTVCDKMFHQKRSLQAHMTVHAPRKFVCEACPRQFRLATHLKYHVRQAHTRENLVHCQICGFGFTHGARLKVHMLTHFKIRPHKCHLCPSAFANKTQLRIHIMRHKGEKKHFCKMCGQGFVCGSALRIHSRVHTGEKPYECDICHQKFATTGNRKIHMRLKHTRERPYSCSVCGKTFNLSNGLKAHMRIHTDEKPYSCDICGKAFRQSSHLHTHKRTHTGERPFPCPHCYKTFTQQSHLTTHLVTHTGEKTFTCQVCNKSFALAHSLKVHMRLHGSEAYKCNMCGEQFVTWNQYKAHQEMECVVEESSCSVCEKTFREPGALVEHMKIHVKESTHMCNVCGKTFQHQCSLTAHMKIHTGERRFACDICNASFAQSSHLKSHVTQKHKYR